MNIGTSPFPSVGWTPFYIAMDGLAGYCCGRLYQVNPYLTATIFAMRAVANTLFYQMANHVLKGKDLKSHKIHFFTSTFANTIFFVALREFSLIGRFFSCLIVCAIIGDFNRKITYIHNQEKQSIGDENLKNKEIK